MPPYLAQDIHQNARAAADLLRVLGNEHRLQVLCALREGEMSVGDLAERLGLSQSALSQHLARLRGDRLVATRRQGQTIFYRVSDVAVLAILEALAGAIQKRRERGLT